MTQPAIEIIVPNVPTVEVNTSETYYDTFIGPSNPNFTSPGIWIQTGLGTTGNDYMIWFENGAK